MTVELGLITCAGVFDPALAGDRLEHTANDRVARTLSAWLIIGRLITGASTAPWGGPAGLTGTRTAIATAGLLMPATPLLLPRLEPARQDERGSVGSSA